MGAYKVIVVDDERFIRAGLEAFKWDRLGFAVIGSAANGQQALELMERSPADVVVTDIKMPVMDGITLCEKLSARYPGCMLVILTGHDDFHYAVSAIRSRVFEYLLKPVELSELSACMVRLKTELDSRREEAERLLGYKLQLQEALPIAARQLFRDMLTGRIKDADVLEEKLDLLEIRLAEPYVLSVVYRPAQAEDEEELRDKLTEEYSRRGLAAFWTDIDRAAAAIVQVPVDKEGRIELARLSEVLDAIAEAGPTDGMRWASFGAGYPVRKLTELPGSYAAANRVADAYARGEREAIGLTWPVEREEAEEQALAPPGETGGAASDAASPEGHPKSSAHAAVARAIQYIEAHYHEKISLQQAADHVYLNASYLSQQFKKEVGQNFVQYLKNFRMEKAKELLRRPEFKIYHICELIGYQNQQYFTDLFKEYTGMTPMEYRQSSEAE